ncbi:MAG: septal ring lytic transglycosylase RlpA family protein [Cyanobacteria bacterium J06560_2]
MTVFKPLSKHRRFKLPQGKRHAVPYKPPKAIPVLGRVVAGSAGLLIFLLGASAAIAQRMRVSWYGPGFDGGYTASGEIFDRYDYTAAHPSWPFGTLLQLTNPNTGDRVFVRINDRSGGALDISEQAARDLGTYSEGIVSVDVEIVQWGEENY